MTNFQRRTPIAIEEGNEDLCRALWISVAIQALLDAKGRNVCAAKQAHACEWIEARAGVQSEFASVCDLAGLDFEETRRIFRKMLSGKMQVIDFRCAKKALIHNRESENRRRYFQRAARNRQERLYRVN